MGVARAASLATRGRRRRELASSRREHGHDPTPDRVTASPRDLESKSRTNVQTKAPAALPGVLPSVFLIGPCFVGDWNVGAIDHTQRLGARLCILGTNPEKRPAHSAA